MQKFNIFIIPVLCLLLIDQITKTIISFAFMQYDFDIIKNFITFNPKLNTELSWAGNYIDIFSSPLVTVLLNVIAIFIFLTGYLLYKAKREQTKLSVKVIMVCGLAGCLCSLIDKLLWGGSLDFLQILDLFIFDLKDCYLTVAEVLFVIIGVLHNKEISVKEYSLFCYHKFKL
ncbi:signal peptidase II [Blautia marasmi]|uniref:signal peptidase II n=1 Tax=Blautia marasmi TaxID=1917868 RepID=UPI000CF23C2D|nr:signal peptidase II [Blautia marasmi]